MKNRLSLSVKATCFVVLVCTLLTSIAVTLSYSVYVDRMNEFFNSQSKNLAWTVASQVDGDKMAMYVDTMTIDEDYKKMLKLLIDIKNRNDIMYLYVFLVRGTKAVYVMDADDEAPLPLGYNGPMHEETYPYLDHLENGVPPFLNYEDGEWLSSAYAPIFNSRGEVAALVGVDISMDYVMARRKAYMQYFLSIMAVAMVIIITLSLKLMNRLIVSPIDKLAAAAGAFTARKGKSERYDAMEPYTSAIAALDIHTGDEIESLCAAMQTMSKDIMEYVKNITAITAERERISVELNAASRIQVSMLPRTFPPFPERKEFELHALIKSAKEVGGDFYDFFMLDHDHLAVVVADVSGKGMPAALFMVVSKTVIKEQIIMNDRLDRAFEEANRLLCEGNGEDMFVTAWAGVFEISTGLLTFVNAGHNPPLVRQGNGGFEFVQTAPELVLAVMPGVVYAQHEITLAPGDALFLYTDGVTEANDALGHLYGNERLKETLDEARDKQPEDLLNSVLSDIERFADGALQADDITMVGLRVNMVERSRLYEMYERQG
ncbi:hypothetical protein AGMMS49957_14810 [Synergistales bacterium]|nr:hypothetical protein AGMMS49957_14810 [Synergistales bacterium]